jgi:hypothetical protein
MYDCVVSYGMLKVLLKKKFDWASMGGGGATIVPLSLKTYRRKKLGQTLYFLISFFQNFIH